MSTPGPLSSKAVGAAAATTSWGTAGAVLLGTGVEAGATAAGAVEIGVGVGIAVWWGLVLVVPKTTPAVTPAATITTAPITRATRW
jgi:hypothetical protein